MQINSTLPSHDMPPVAHPWTTTTASFINTRRRLGSCFGIVAGIQTSAAHEPCNGRSTMDRIEPRHSIGQNTQTHTRCPYPNQPTLPCLEPSFFFIIRRPLTYRSTRTAGICTSCTGLLRSFSAWVRFRIWPRITAICLSNAFLLKPLSCCKGRDTGLGGMVLRVCSERDSV